MIGYRRAAVALHGVSEADRSWVLNALPATDREAVQQMLAELKELGFGDDLGAVMNVSRETINAKSGDEISALERIRAARAEQLFSILEHEPSSLIAQFISIEKWSWSGDFLALFPVARKERILASVSHTLDIPSAKVSFLIEAVGNRIAATASDYVGAGEKMDTSFARLREIASPLRRLVSTWIR